MKQLEGKAGQWILISLIYIEGDCQVEVFSAGHYNNMNILLKILKSALVPNKNTLDTKAVVP